MYDLVTLGRRARSASRALRTADASQRNAALFSVSRALQEKKAEILAANRTDVELARSAGCRADVIERLSLTAARIEALSARIDAVIAAPDPIWVTVGGAALQNGPETRRVRVPIGVIALVADAAPLTTVDTLALCLKSGNVCVLSGGRNAYGTSRALAQVLRQAIGEAGLTPDALLLVEDVSEETTRRLAAMNEWVDLLLPCGDAAFVHALREVARVPMLDTSGGCCCLYIDRSADLQMAVRIADSARTAAPADPISTDTLLVHSEIAEEFLPKLEEALDLHAVELRGCERARQILPWIAAAREEDWGLDYRGMTLNLRIVDTTEEALAFIERYSDRTADGIVSEHLGTVSRFCALADAAVVCVNTPPRSAWAGSDESGVSLGFSSGRLHVRGPIGLESLTTLKTVVIGDGRNR